MSRQPGPDSWMLARARACAGLDKREGKRSAVDPLVPGA